MISYYIKALHIIFIVTWFSGLFYIVRLFIYHVEAQKKPDNERKILQEQYKIMERRLWYFITWPSMILTVTFGFWLAYLMNVWTEPWFLLKLALVFGLILYHLECGRIYHQLKKDMINYSSARLRIWNEVATLFLVSIVFIAELKNLLNWAWGILGIIMLAGILLLAIKLYKNVRSTKENNSAKINSDV